MTANSFRTLNDRAHVKGSLVKQIERSREKDGINTADTREVANRCGFSLSRTRRHLHALWDAGEIEAFDGEGNGMGKAILWGLAKVKELPGHDG